MAWHRLPTFYNVVKSSNILQCCQVNSNINAVLVFTKSGALKGIFYKIMGYAI